MCNKINSNPPTQEDIYQYKIVGYLEDTILTAILA